MMCLSLTLEVKRSVYLRRAVCGGDRNGGGPHHHLCRPRCYLNSHRRHERKSPRIPCLQYLKISGVPRDVCNVTLCMCRRRNYRGSDGITLCETPIPWPPLQQSPQFSPRLRSRDCSEETLDLTLNGGMKYLET